MSETQKRYHVGALLAALDIHGEVVAGLAADGLQWIRSHKALLRSLAIQNDCRRQMDEAIWKDLTGMPVSAQFLRNPLDIDGAALWPAADDRTAHRVGFLASSYLPIGGTETFHRTLLPRLRNRVNVAGLAVTAYSGGNGSTLEVPYATGSKAAQRLAAHCGVVVAWGIEDLPAILPANRPRVVAVHHSDWSSSWSNRTILTQLPLIDDIVCVNEDTAKKLATFGKPVHYIPNAIDFDRITPTGNLSELREDHGISADSKICLFGHRLSHEKRPVFAVEIAKQLPSDWTMVICGDGPERQAVEAAAEGCDRVRVVGQVDSLADWLAVSSCFLSLSTFEGFGLAVGEALAAGLPTVSTATGIAPGLATTMPTDASAAEWAEAIISAKKLVRPEVFLERFSVERMVSAWANVLKD